MSTDLLGTLVLSSALFAQHTEASRKVLIIYSYVRHANFNLDLETRRAVPPASGFVKAERAGLPDLQNEDLYYRLNVVAIHQPLLRDRKQYIPALVQHFLHRGGSCSTYDKVQASG
jgi:hypothetical protein